MKVKHQLHAIAIRDNHLYFVIQGQKAIKIPLLEVQQILKQLTPWIAPLLKDIVNESKPSEDLVTYSMDPASEEAVDHFDEIKRRNVHLHERLVQIKKQLEGIKRYNNHIKLLETEVSNLKKLADLRKQKIELLNKKISTIRNEFITFRNIVKQLTS